jgi:putative salt-induced outer membrane protein YdiY
MPVRLNGTRKGATRFALHHVFLIAATIMPLSADQVVFTNGDRVSGKIIKKDGDKITVKSDLLGDVTAPWTAVASVVADDPLTVVLPDGRTVVGTLTTAKDNVQVKTPTATESAALTGITNIRNADEQREYERLLNPGFFDLWKGYVDFGYALARGNARTNVMTTSMNSNRVTRTDKTSIYFNQVYSSARTNNIVSDTASAIRGGWAYNRNITPRVFINVFNDYEYDRFQSLDLRFVFGAGLGYTVYKSERSQLDLVGGFAYNREKFFVQTRNSAEAYWGDDWTYAVSGTTSFKQSFRMFNNLTRSGEYRINFDIGAVTAINRYLGVQLTVSDRFLTNPALGRQRNDILFTTGIRFTFAR